MSENNENKNPPRHGPRAMMMNIKAKDFKKGFKRFIKYLAPFYVGLIIAILLSVVSTVCAILGPDILGDMTDVCSTPLFGIPIDFAKINYYGIVLVCLYIASAVFEYFQGFITGIISARIGYKMRLEISNKINNLPLKYFNKKSYGDTLSRITNDVDTIAQSLNQSLAQIISSITTVIGIIIIMFTISWQLTLTSLLCIPIGLIAVALIVKKSQKYYKTQQKTLGALNGHIEEIYSNHNIVKAYNGIEQESEKFNNLNNTLYKAGYKNQFFGSLMMPIMQFSGNLGFVAVSVVGGVLAVNGAVTIGAILSFMIYVRIFTRPLQSLASIANILQATVAASERVFEFLDEKEEEKQTNTKKLTEVKGNIVFKNVKFGYNKEKVIIKNFNLEVKAGQKVAIVGKTGAGKTTLVNLLERFYEIDDGDILIDGISIKEMSKQDVRKLFGMVLQDSWLFEGSIKENLKFGKDDASDEEIIEACKNANIYNFINHLPEKFDHILGENTNISQGQKQLLTIARAMIQNAPMMILDEATSSVDTRTEILIQQAMDKLSKNKTSFVIAHRLSTIKNADIILVISDGDIVEKGTHKELLKKNGEYAHLYNSQFSEEME